LAAALPTLALLAAGFALALLLLGRGVRRRSVLFLALALAPGLGAGWLSIAGFLVLLLGSAGALGLMALFALGLAKTLPAAPPQPSAGSPATRLEAAGAAAALLAAGFTAFVFFSDLAARPDGGGDAVAIWNVRARTLFHARGETGDLLQRMKLGHPDYPLLLPAALAAQFEFAGSASSEIPQATALAFLLGTAALAASTVERLGRRLLAAPAAILVLSAPHLTSVACQQYADVPLAYFLLASLGSLACALHPDPSRRLPPAIGGMCLGFLGWTKNEGLVLAVILALLFLAHLFLSPRPQERIRSVASFLAGLIPPLVAIVFFKIAWAPPGDFVPGVGEQLRENLFDPARWRASASGYLREMGQWQRWGWAWPFLAGAVLLLGPRPRTAIATLPRRLLSLSLLACSAAWVTVYVVTPAPQQWHIATSLDRLLLHLFPSVCVWALARLEVT
jgi:hypothetical protein